MDVLRKEKYMSKELKLIIDAEGIEKQILSLKDKFEYWLKSFTIKEDIEVGDE